jgi:glyoxylase-like metal-dependent hydrolase (beta-lactamase superfamily II)
MEVLSVASGLWRWTGFHEEWKEDVGCVYYEARDGLVLIDPLVPPEDTERFWRALDDDVARAARPVHVLVSVYWHTRSAREMVERYGARLWAPSRGRAAVARRAGKVTDPFRPGDQLPGGVEAFGTARSSEVVYWLPEHGALVAGDVLLGDGAGGIRLCPASWLPQGVGHAKLRASLRPLLDLPVERVLLSHGTPVLADAWRALARAIAG